MKTAEKISEEGLGIEWILEQLFDDTSAENPAALVVEICEQIEGIGYDDPEQLVMDLLEVAERIRLREDTLISEIVNQFWGNYSPMEEIIEDVCQTTEDERGEEFLRAVWEEAHNILRTHRANVGPWCDQCGHYPDREVDLEEALVYCRAERDALRARIRRLEIELSDLNIVARSRLDERSS